MNKEINDNDRIVIGVREWAVKEAMSIHFDLFKDNPDIVGVVKTATELEKYVLEGFKD